MGTLRSQAILRVTCRRQTLLSTSACLLFVATALGSTTGCRSSSNGDPTPAGLTILAPADGASVDTFAFTIEVETDADVINLDSVAAALNEVPIELFRDGDRLLASVNPGPPLRDANALVLQATTLAGRAFEVTSSFAYLPPKARARRITDPADLIEGPLAHGRIGDYLLENDVARYIVQDAGRRELANVATFGGNIIDAELRANPGNDNFLEIQPMVNVETVINAQTIEVVHDGQDGTAAIIRSCGPDDPLDFINPSSNIREMLGIDLPPEVDDADYDVTGCTEYALAPGTPQVRMTTTIHNHEAEDLRLFVGDYIAAGGALAPWQISTQGRSGIGEILTTPVTALSLIGFDDADGWGYFYVPVPKAGSAATTDVLSIAGVNVALFGNSILQSLSGAPSSFLIPAGGSNSYTRFFAASEGSGAEAVDLVHAISNVSTGTVRGCVTMAGEPAPRARVAIGRTSGGLLRGLSTHFVTGDDGCFAGTLQPGDYGATAARVRTPFENSAATPHVRPFTIAAGEDVYLEFDLPRPARLRVDVRDESGDPLPARITLVGFDPGSDPGLATPMPIGSTTTWLFRDIGDDRVTFGVADFEYSGADGRAEFDAKPGEYHLIVSRGAEYSMFDTRIVLVGGETLTVDAQIARVLDTRGFVSSDFHVHGINSTDSRVGLVNRVLQFAGEGIENIVMTEHSGRTDLTPTIEALGLTERVRATIGEEITTWEYGHYNGFPFDIDPDHQTGGAVDWAGAAEPGRDFVAYGSFGLTPAEVAEEALTGPGARASTVLQANHVASYYSPLRIDTSLVPPQSFLSPEGKLAFRLDPESGNLFHHFPVMEVWNGHARSHQARFFGGEIGIWFNLLNQGLFTAGTGVTDTHGYYNLNASGARTWTASSSDEPAAIDPDEIADHTAAGRAVMGQGLYVQARLHATDGSNAFASFDLDGSTLVASEAGVELEIHVQAPLWGAYDRIEVYANAPTFPTRQEDGINVLFGAEPAVVLHAGIDFDVDEVDVFPAIAGARRLQSHLVIPFPELERDTWFVVVVRGSDGVSQPMFPVAPANLSSASNATLDDLMDGNLGESGTMAMGITNPLFADVDGEPGFQAMFAP